MKIRRNGIVIASFSEINEEMKMAVAVALADLAREPVPSEVRAAFPDRKSFDFGPEYVVPTPFDPRLLRVVATATAKDTVRHYPKISSLISIINLIRASFP